MDRSLGFGSNTYNFVALLTLGFPSASYLKHLTSLHTFTRRTVLQKVRYRTRMVLYLLVNIGFQVLFTPLPGFFSPFLHSTASLSVIRLYLGLGGGPPGFPASSSCSPVLWILSPAFGFRLRDFHPLRFGFPTNSANRLQWIIQSATPVVFLHPVWPLSLSLAATQKIDVSFSSSAYLDVSVQRVSPQYAMCLHTVDCAWPQPGFPIRKSAGKSDICSLPQLIAAYHVLLRHLIPRHSPYALISLTCFQVSNRIIWVYALL